MIRNETFQDGVCIYAEIIDLDAGTFTVEDNGVVTLTRDLTLDEHLRYGPQPLDKHGATAALNAALGLWPLADAANIAGVSEQALITEVEGWAAARDIL